MDLSGVSVLRRTACTGRDTATYMPNTLSVPTRGTRAIAEASIVSAARSSGSRLFTSPLPSDRVSSASSMVIELRKLATLSAPSSGSSRFTSSGSCVAIPTGHLPVWHRLQEPAGRPISFSKSASGISRLQFSAISAAIPIATASAPSASAFATSAPFRIPPEAIRLTLR